MKTWVYITTDVETSMGGGWANPNRHPLPVSKRITCETNGSQYGLPLILEELKRHGMQGSFFCEMLATPILGQDQMKCVVGMILEAGQDVQLHAHPTFYHYNLLQSGEQYRCLPPHEKKAVLCRNEANDFFSAYTEEEQLELMGKSVESFVGLTGRRPKAFRAGCYGANYATLRVLDKLGIRIDSSFNPSYSWNLSHTEKAPTPNCVQEVENVWEIPVTAALTGLPDSPGYKHLEIPAISNYEIEYVLNFCHERGMQHIVIVLHSFCLVKYRDRYCTEMRPNRIAIKRLRRLLEYLHRNENHFLATSLGNLSENLHRLQSPQTSAVPRLPVIPRTMRKIIQGINRLYWL